MLNGEDLPLCIPCLPGTLFSKTFSFRLHRLKHYTYKVLPRQYFERTFWRGCTSKIFSFLRESGMYSKKLIKSRYFTTYGVFTQLAGLDSILFC